MNKKKKLSILNNRIINNIKLLRNFKISTKRMNFVIFK